MKKAVRISINPTAQRKDFMDIVVPVVCLPLMGNLLDAVKAATPNGGFFAIYEDVSGVGSDGRYQARHSYTAYYRSIVDGELEVATRCRTLYKDCVTKKTYFHRS